MRTHKNLYVGKYIVGMMLTSTLLLSSCNEDTIFEENKIETTGEGIHFGLSKLDNSWEPDTRSAKSGNRFVMRSENSSDTLCVSTSVLDGISTASGVESRGVRKNTLNGNSFQVKAYYYDEDASTPSSVLFDQSYNVAEKDGTISLGNDAHTYYWPQTGGFTFLATANANGLTITDQKDGNYVATPSLSYTIASNVTDQKDAMVAFTGNTLINNNDNGAAVPLTFTHLCAAVQFQLKSEVDNDISSIEISNVYGGTINYIYDDTDPNGPWVPNYNHAESTNYTTALSTESSSEEETTLLLAPQTLTANARITVHFSDGRESVTTEAGALYGNVWEMGMTYIYKLSITPEYTLEFIGEPKVQDAHYEIYPIKIKTENLPEGGWTLTSNDPQNVTFVENFKDDELKRTVVVEKYWLKKYCGTSSISSTTSGEIDIYVFLKENTTKEDRNITLSLSLTNNKNIAPKTFTFTQYCPAWKNGIGVERIQDKDYQWGFNWDNEMKITYSMPNNFWTGIIHILFTIWGDHSYVSQSGLVLLGNWKVTVDFSKVPTLNTATDETNGLTNTWQLYNFSGINDATTIMSQLESWGGVPDKKLPGNPGEFAAWACAKKNQYDVEEETEGGKTTYKPILKQDDLKWYLPSKGEATNMNDNLEGDYWTSTAITKPGTTAWKYTAGNSTTAEDRQSNLHVRAVRKEK